MSYILDSTLRGYRGAYSGRSGTVSAPSSGPALEDAGSDSFFQRAGPASGTNTSSWLEIDYEGSTDGGLSAGPGSAFSSPQAYDALDGWVASWDVAGVPERTYYVHARIRTAGGWSPWGETFVFNPVPLVAAITYNIASPQIEILGNSSTGPITSWSWSLLTDLAEESINWTPDPSSTPGTINFSSITLASGWTVHLDLNSGGSTDDIYILWDGSTLTAADDIAAGAPYDPPTFTNLTAIDGNSISVDLEMSGGSEAVHIYLNETSGDGGEAGANIAGINATINDTYTFTGLTPGQWYMVNGHSAGKGWTSADSGGVYVQTPS